MRSIIACFTSTPPRLCKTSTPESRRGVGVNLGAETCCSPARLSVAISRMADSSSQGSVSWYNPHLQSSILLLRDRPQISLRSPAVGSPIPMDFAEIIAIRHGETTWNACRKIQGHLDVELNEVGRQQATAVANRLSKEFKISTVYSSDLKRALETAEIIATACGLPTVVQDATLRERHLGDLQGLVFQEAAKLKPKAYQAFVSRKKDQEIPGGGESLDQLYQRCTSSLERIAAKHKGERIVVVTHGGTLRALHERAASKGSLKGKVLNTSINIFQLSDDNWAIKTWGDVSHLDETGFLNSGFGGDRNSG